MIMYKIKSAVVTFLHMFRNKLITKEKMENYCKGKEAFESEDYDALCKDSVNDDLESFFQHIQHGKELKYNTETYFLPKLTKKELKLVERKDPIYMKTFDLLTNADVDETEMKMSESKSKFVEGFGWRRTFTLHNPYLKS